MVIVTAAESEVDYIGWMRKKILLDQKKVLSAISHMETDGIF